MTTLSVSLVDFEPVNACWDVTRSLLNNFLIYFKNVMQQMLFMPI